MTPRCNSNILLGKYNTMTPRCNSNLLLDFLGTAEHVERGFVSAGYDQIIAGFAEMLRDAQRCSARSCRLGMSRPSWNCSGATTGFAGCLSLSTVILRV
jgi:hypothetical protein